jgi:hypothetical protein
MARGNRTGRGWFEPGKSGNPRGRSKADFDLAEQARTHAAEAIATLVDVMRTSEKGTERIQAALALLDRGFGRPPASLDVGVIPGSTTPTIVVNVVRKEPATERAS